MVSDGNREATADPADWSAARALRCQADRSVEAARSLLDYYFEVNEVKGKGAPARRIIGLGGTWQWNWPSSMWVHEQAAKHLRSAARFRRKAAARDRTRRRQRRGTVLKAGLKRSLDIAPVAEDVRDHLMTESGR